MNSINLIPAQRRTLTARRRRVRAWAAACAGCALALALGAASFRLVRSVDPAGVRAQIDSAAARADAAEAELTRLVAQARERERALDAARIVGVHPDWSVLLRAINTARGESVALERIELRSDPIKPPPSPPASGSSPSPSTPPPRHTERYILTLSGIATGVQDVTRFVTELESLGAMHRVWLKGTSPRVVRGVSVSGFEIECTLMEREPARVEVAP